MIAQWIGSRSMGYKAAFYGAVGLLIVAVAVAWNLEVWSSKPFWDEANKYGLFFTIFGTLFTVVTFFYVGMFGEKLKRRHRIPETHKDLQQLLLEIRQSLKDWKGRENDIIDLLYQVQGHLENVSQKLDGVEKSSAKQLVSSIAREGVFYIGRRKLTEEVSWDIQRKLQRFVTQLGAKHQDNEVERL
ncbi:hypothetical protein HX792_07835 [Pseudomonas sp. B6002]|uniref:hypothetical protein n=1 Tax=Pseudomonas sp. B6002 TaxID=2726978 RepID=UPI0015A1A89D|nr:hypothetical protein [Pseudomonas sp. B6002]NVZ50239.1 hypothetical protein [Pseudomonas sp. B6002]